LLVHTSAGWLWVLPLWTGVIVVMYLYRDPLRKIPAVALGVLSPVDGRVLGVRGCRDERLERAAVRISIRVGPASVLIARSPVEGTLIDAWQEPTRGASIQPHAGEHVGRGFGMWLRTDEGDRVRVSMRGPDFWRPRCGVRVGERLGQGQRCGRVPISACVQVWVPENAIVNVQSGQKLRAGRDVLATLVREPVSVAD
jgi:phosphatidylserine decarboxylase